MKRDELSTALLTPSDTPKQKREAPRPGRLTSTKVLERHLARLALVYVRYTGTAGNWLVKPSRVAAIAPEGTTWLPVCLPKASATSSWSFGETTGLPADCLGKM